MAFVAGFSVAFCLAIKLKEDARASRYRADYVTLVTSRYLVAISDKPREPSALPDHPMLRARAALLRATLAGEGPAELAAILERRVSGSRLGIGDNVLVARWLDDLHHWARVDPSDDDLLSDARESLALASGYAGTSLEGAMHLLRSARIALRRLLENPEGNEAPEALYLLGESLRRLRSDARHGEPADTLLRLCVDQYPGTVWAQLARARADQRL